MHVMSGTSTKTFPWTVYWMLLYLTLSLALSFFFSLSSDTNEDGETSSLKENKQVQCILLSDTSIEKVAADVNVFTEVHSSLIPLFWGKLICTCLFYFLDFSEFEQSDDEDSNEENSQLKSTPKGRKKIRKIIEDENLRAETQEALREEEERRKRLANRDQQMEDRREVRVYISNVTTHFSNKLYVTALLATVTSLRI